jgi:hypothetical protein
MTVPAPSGPARNGGARFAVAAVSRVLERRSFLLECFVAFVAIRVAILAFIPTAAPFSDAGWYLRRAITLAEQGTYSEGGVPTAYWPVGYPAFLAGIFTIFGPSLLAARIANLVLASISFWLLYRVAQRSFGDELVARLTVLFLALYPNNAAYVPLLLTETLYTFLLLAASVVLLGGKSWVQVGVAGLILGLATLVKSQTLLLIPVLAVLAFMRQWSWKAFADAAIRGAGVLGVAMLVLTPWTLRNYSVFGAFIPVSTNGGMTLLTGNNPSTVGDYRSDFSETDSLAAQARFSVRDQVAADARARTLAVNWIASNPMQFARLVPKKLFRLWAPNGEAEWAYQDTQYYRTYAPRFRLVRVLNQAFYVAVILLCLGASIRLLKRPVEARAWYGLGVIGCVTAISIVFSGQSRYHFPAMPFVLAYAALYMVSAGGMINREPGERPRLRMRRN